MYAGYTNPCNYQCQRSIAAAPWTESTLIPSSFVKEAHLSMSGVKGLVERARVVLIAGYRACVVLIGVGRRAV